SAQQAEPATPATCGTFQTSGIFQDNKLQVQFLLYTPRNPTCGQAIHINQSGSIERSMFNSSLETKIIIHGFRVLGTKPSWTENLVEALLGAGAANVVLVDWVSGSTAKYSQSVENVPKLSSLLVALIKRFLDLGSTLESLHLIGVSLGAHVAGSIGEHFGGQIGWITGLDPAAYQFTRTHPEDRLDSGDALFVDAVHTDTDNFGIRIPVGHIDYFINGGRDQPGCPSLTNLYQYLICDHMRSVAVFISAVRGKCSFVGFPCSTYKEFQEGLCVDCETPKLSSCPRLGRKDGLIIPGEFEFQNFISNSQNYTSTVGYKTQEPPKEIQLFLLTTPEEPYCTHHILLEFTLSKPKAISITMEIQLYSADSSRSSKTKITIPKETLEGRGLAAHGTRLCLLDKVQIRVLTKSGFWRRGPEFTG
ncbi:PREDICTED: phospholipase A1 member A, partial [Nanorana parkeri]|uniref:phospholipase A1 member A n=1 Tax=Nanorana parkeri TaxID=125878 RepID=UPI000853F2CD